MTRMLEPCDYYVSIDVETTGLAPGVNASMISLGAAFYTLGGVLTRTFSANLVELPGHPRLASTMKWWEEHPEEWKVATEGQKDPFEVMEAFAGVMKASGKNPIMIGWPAAFDYAFVDHYMARFQPKMRIRHVCCVKSCLAERFGIRFDLVNRHNLPASWKPVARAPHIALNDALMQGEVFFKLEEHRSW